MGFKYYCIVALGNIEGISDIIKKISDLKVSTIEQKGVLISTFSSNMSVNELKYVIGLEGRTFFIFPVEPNVSAFNIGSNDKHDQMFSHILGMQVSQELNDMSNTLNKINFNEINNVDSPEIIVNNMSIEERSKKIDELLEIGLQNLNEDERKMLEIISKNLD